MSNFCPSLVKYINLFIYSIGLLPSTQEYFTAVTTAKPVRGGRKLGNINVNQKLQINSGL